MTTTYRAIRSMNMPDITPGGADMPEPTFERAKPGDLLVDETYQRNLSERSVRLIRKIVTHWDWRTFMPPVVVRTRDGLHVIDAQHTAIAAASHPKIIDIPVMVVKADEMADRAKTFLGRNRDRISVTANQLHYAAIAAGDDVAVTIKQVCARAGIRILKQPPRAAVFKTGDTLAISTITSLINRRGALRARQVLEVLGNAKLAPVPQTLIKAVEELLCNASREVTLIRLPQASAQDATSAAAASQPTPEGLSPRSFAPSVSKRRATTRLSLARGRAVRWRSGIASGSSKRAPLIEGFVNRAHFLDAAISGNLVACAHIAISNLINVRHVGWRDAVLSCAAVKMHRGIMHRFRDHPFHVRLLDAEPTATASFRCGAARCLIHRDIMREIAAVWVCKARIEAVGVLRPALGKSLAAGLEAVGRHFRGEGKIDHLCAPLLTRPTYDEFAYTQLFRNHELLQGQIT